MSQKYKGLDNRNLRLLNQSDAELVFQKYRKAIWIFQKAKSLTEAARKLKITRKQATNLANTIRRGGVEIKTFNKHWLKLSPEKIESLAILAKELSVPATDYEKFVRIWQKEGCQAVMEEFSFNRNKASWIANWLRKRCNIPLKNYRTPLSRKNLQRIALETATASSPNIPPHKPPRPPQ